MKSVRFLTHGEAKIVRFKRTCKRTKQPKNKKQEEPELEIGGLDMGNSLLTLPFKGRNIIGLDLFVNSNLRDAKLARLYCL